MRRGKKQGEYWFPIQMYCVKARFEGPLKESIAISWQEVIRLKLHANLSI